MNNIVYSQELEDFLEQQISSGRKSSKIAKDAIKLFNVKSSRTTLEKKISRLKSRKIKGYDNCGNKIKVCKGRSVRRLFFDIETSPCLGWFWRPGYNQNVLPHQIIGYAKIICISYKWEGDEKVYNLWWDEDQNDKEMMKKFIKIMNDADECVAHNGDRFDEKWIRTRCIYHRIPAFPKYKTLDTLKKAKSGFNFPSNKLDEIGKYLGVGRKIVNDLDLWERVFQQNDRKALKKMVNYCDQDVVLLEDIFNVLNPYITNNTNLTVLNGGKKWHCPTCGSKKVQLSKTTTTTMGAIQRWMQCDNCNEHYKITNKSYMDSCDYKIKNN